MPNYKLIKAAPEDHARPRMGRPTIYPFEAMQRGECVEIPVEGDIADHRRKLSPTVYNHIPRKHPGRCYVMRSFRDEGLIRVYRTA